MLKKIYTAIILFTALFLLQAQLYAGTADDHEKIVPTDQFLNEFIASDTVGGADPNRVYILQRDEDYFINANFENSYPLRIVAAEGSGDMPRIYLSQLPDGGYPSNPFLLSNNIYLKGIKFEGRSPSDPSEGGSQALVFVAIAGYDLVIDSCIISNVYGQFVRTQSPLRKLQITNSILGNSGLPTIGVMGIGKGIDMRGGSLDTAIFRNNTWVNLADRVIRHRGSSAKIHYFEFDHNSIVQNMSYSGVLELGQVGKEVKITNNLLFNVYGYGRDLEDFARHDEFNGSGNYEVEENGAPKMTILNVAVYDTTGGIPGNDSTVFAIRNNYYSYTQDLQNWWASNGLLKPHIMLDSLKNKLDDPGNAFIEEAGLNLSNIPAPAFELMERYRQDFQRAAITTGEDYDRKSLKYLSDTLDCAYPTTAAAFTGADGGLPAGDLNWWSGVVGINEDYTANNLPAEFGLEQNYPNPFNPTTTINFSLAKTTMVTLNVYNILGQQVAQLINGELNAGRYNYEFNASNLSSGVYLYTIKAGNFVESRKMLLIK